MLRILRAFAWMRWRIFVNSLEKTGARDTVQRVSLAIEHVAPILVLIVMIPTAIALAGVSAYTGYQLATAARAPGMFEFLRYLILGATAFTLIGPILLPAADRTNPVRLLLLPIPPRALYAAQAGGALADPWMMMTLPIVLALPLGLAAGAAIAAAGAALIAGILLVVTLVGLSALTTTLIHLLLRDRRRGELLALLFILILPVASFLPSVLGAAGGRERRAARDRGPDAPHGMAPATRVPAWVEEAGTRVFPLVPSEAYATTIRASRVSARSAAPSFVALAGGALLIHGIGLLLFGRVLGSPGTTGARRTASMRGVWGRVVPGVSPGTSAVASALVRLAIRTPRGRAIMLSPIIMLLFFGFLAFRSASFDFGPFGRTGGLGLATFASFIALLSILPIAMNQFAVDGGGLTMALLSPLSTRQLLAGKAIGGALIALTPAWTCVLLAAATFRSGDPAMWAALVVSLPAIYVLAAPVAAISSAIFPRVVDMNSIGRGSNAHGLAGLLGIVAFAAAGLPCIAIVLIATQLLHRPWLAAALLLVWCVVAAGCARVLFVAAERIFDRRRENLALLM